MANLQDLVTAIGQLVATQTALTQQLGQVQQPQA
jgi:hypothetical protein